MRRVDDLKDSAPHVVHYRRPPRVPRPVEPVPVCISWVDWLIFSLFQVACASALCVVYSIAAALR
jgi:hypothetical protein